jgi:UDP-3-O-[3-hydroxymyristoyl] N-acetylglucosamine deacetylase
MHPFTRKGVGVHSGEECEVRVLPGTWGEGIVFHYAEHRIKACIENARAGEGCTQLTNGQGLIQTPEHFLAACAGLGLTDLQVMLSAPELPILDGSALPWWLALHESATEQGPAMIPRKVRTVVSVSDEASHARLSPADHCEVIVHVAFGEEYPHGEARSVLPCEHFGARVAPARTFCLERDVARLQAAGRGKGANIGNTLVLRPGGVVNPEGMRRANEPVLHKLLDAVGDFWLLGPVQGKFEVHLGSHRLHQKCLAAAAQQHGWGSLHSPAP